MLTFLMILLVIASVLLIIIILAQNPKGSGLSTLGASASQYLGTRQTADFLEKSTWYFGIGILVVVIVSYFMITPNGGPAKSRVEGSDYTPPMTTQSATGPNKAPNPLQTLPTTKPQTPVKK